MPAATHDDIKKTLDEHAASQQPQAMTPPPQPDMPRTWNYSHLPQFLQDSIDKAKLRYIRTTDPKYGTTAAVESSDPYLVHVVNPNSGQSRMDHELTHTLQFLHPDAKFAPVAEEGDKYAYGGPDGLMKVGEKRKLSDYSIEQTAAMVNDYARYRDEIFDRAKKMPLDDKELKRWNQVQAAYAPLIRQLGKLGGHVYPEFKPTPGHLTDLPEFSDQVVPYKTMKTQVSMGPK